MEVGDTPDDAWLFLRYAVEARPHDIATCYSGGRASTTQSLASSSPHLEASAPPRPANVATVNHHGKQEKTLTQYAYHMLDMAGEKQNRCLTRKMGIQYSRTCNVHQ